MKKKYVIVKFINYPKQYIYSTTLDLIKGGIYKIASSSKTYETPAEVLSVSDKNTTGVKPVEIISAKCINAPKRPKCDAKVYSNKEKKTTVVIWPDGQKTIVKCQPGDEFDAEKGIAMCFVKKYFNNRGCFNEWMKKVLKENEVDINA